MSTAAEARDGGSSYLRGLAAAERVSAFVFGLSGRRALLLAAARSWLRDHPSDRHHRHRPSAVILWPLALVLLAAAFVRVAGRTADEWVAAAVSYQLLALRGQHKILSGPMGPDPTRKARAAHGRAARCFAGDLGAAGHRGGSVQRRPGAGGRLPPVRPHLYSGRAGRVRGYRPGRLGSPGSAGGRLGCPDRGFVHRIAAGDPGAGGAAHRAGERRRGPAPLARRPSRGGRAGGGGADRRDAAVDRVAGDRAARVLPGVHDVRVPGPCRDQGARGAASPARPRSCCGICGRCRRRSAGPSSRSASGWGRGTWRRCYAPLMILPFSRTWMCAAAAARARSGLRAGT